MERWEEEGQERLKDEGEHGAKGQGHGRWEKGVGTCFVGETAARRRENMAMSGMGTEAADRRERSEEVVRGGGEPGKVGEGMGTKREGEVAGVVGVVGFGAVDGRKCGKGGTHGARRGRKAGGGCAHRALKGRGQEGQGRA